MTPAAIAPALIALEASTGAGAGPRARALTAGLFAAAVLYALSGAVLVSHRPALVELTDVFIAGLAPGVLVTWVLGLAHPAAYGRRRRQAMLGLSLLGAGVVAALPLASGF